MIFRPDTPRAQQAPDLFGDIAVFTALALTRTSLAHLARVANHMAAGGTPDELDRTLLRYVSSALAFVANEVEVTP